MMNRESFRFFERNHFFLDVIQRGEFLRFAARSACLEETRARMQGDPAAGSSASSRRASDVRTKSSHSRWSPTRG